MWEPWLIIFHTVLFSEVIKEDRSSELFLLLLLVNKCYPNQFLLLPNISVLVNAHLPLPVRIFSQWFGLPILCSPVAQICFPYRQNRRKSSPLAIKSIYYSLEWVSVQLCMYIIVYCTKWCIFLSCAYKYALKIV